MADRKEQIVEAALDIFAEKGYFNTRVAEIVEKVGIAKGTFYLYFNSKKELFLEMIKRYELLVEENIDLEILQDAEVSLEDKLTKITQNYFDLYLKNKKLTSVINREAVSIDDDFFIELQKMKKTTDKIYRKIYEVLIKNNEISAENDFEMFINLYSGVINSYIMRNSIILGREINIEKQSQDIASYMVRALK